MKLEEIALRNATVARMLRGEGSKDECIVALVEHINLLNKKVMELSMLAPRRIKLPDGSEYVWRCPVEMIPVSEVFVDEAKEPTA